VNFIKKHIIALFLAITLTIVTHAESNFKVYLAKDILWQDATGHSPKGTKIAILEGDPSKLGPYIVRVKFPANTRVEPHFHPSMECATVLSGVLFVGLGDKFDEKKAVALPAGSFSYMKPYTHHYGFTREETIIQLQGVGPWKLISVISVKPSFLKNQLDKAY